MCKLSILCFFLSISLCSYAQHNMLSEIKPKGKYVVSKPEYNFNAVPKDISENVSDRNFKKLTLKRYKVRDSIGIIVKKGNYEQKDIFIFDNQNNAIEMKTILSGKLHRHKFFNYSNDNLIDTIIETQYGFRHKGSLETINTYYEYSDDKIVYKRYNGKDELTDKWSKLFNLKGKLIKESHKTYRYGQEANTSETEYSYDNDILVESKANRSNKIFKDTRVWNGQRDYAIETVYINDSDVLLQINKSGSLTKVSYNKDNKVINRKVYDIINGELKSEWKFQYNPYRETVFENGGNAKRINEIVYDSNNKIETFKTKEENQTSTYFYHWNKQNIQKVILVIENKVQPQKSIKLTYDIERKNNYIISVNLKTTRNGDWAKNQFKKIEIIYDEFDNWTKIIEFESEINKPKKVIERIIEYY